MNFFDRLLIKYYQERSADYQRQIGKYWATDLYNIIEKKITPSDFFKQKEIDLQTAKLFLRGEIVELAVKSLLEKSKKNFSYQEKREMKINDWILTCKPDFLIDKVALEIKGSDNIGNTIKPYHAYQLEAYSRCYPDYQIYILYVNPSQMMTKLHKYQPNAKLWTLIVNSLDKFHLTLKNYDKQLQKRSEGGTGDSKVASNINQ